MLFVVGLIVGLTLGLLIVGFLALGAYDRGLREGLERRGLWRAELKARHAAAVIQVAARAKRAS